MSNKRHNLYDPFSFEGLWWIPQAPDQKVAGTITFAPDTGVILSLVGLLRDMQSALNQGPSSDPVAIHGFSSDGRQITLCDSVPINVRFSFPGIPSEQYKARWAIIGGHVNPSDEFHGCSLGLSMLEEWLGHRTLHHKFGDGESRLSVKLVPPPDQEFDCETIASTLSIAWSYQTAGNGIRSFSLHTWSGLELRGDQPAAVEVWVERALQLRNLVAVCYGHPLSLLRLDIFGDAIEIEPGVPRNETMSVVFQLPLFARQQFDGQNERPIISATDLGSGLN